MKKITDFLTTKRSLKELKITLEILKEFKACQSEREWLLIPFEAWAKLEQLEEFLEFLVNQTPLENDTLEYMQEFSPQGDLNNGNKFKEA